LDTRGQAVIMSNIVKHEASFVTSSQVTVAHGLNSSNLAIQVVSSSQVLKGVAAGEIYFSPTDPANEFTVKFDKPKTGRVVVFQNTMRQLSELTPAEAQKAKDVFTAGRFFASDFYFKHDPNVSSTLSNKAFSTKLVLDVTASASGVYRVAWAYEWGADKTSKDFEIVLKENGAAKIFSHQESTSKHKITSNHSHGFVYRTLTPGIYTYTLEYKSGKFGKQLKIFNAGIEFWKVRNGE